jgi:hypothetical protein
MTCTVEGDALQFSGPQASFCRKAYILSVLQGLPITLLFLHHRIPGRH